VGKQLWLDDMFLAIFTKERNVDMVACCVMIQRPQKLLAFCQSVRVGGIVIAIHQLQAL
jgi:starvation-inducible outer membrane lipoprotein